MKLSMEDNHKEEPNEAIFFVLAYLPLFELLTMAQVCTSLRDAVNDDTLPWLKLVVDRPLNRRLSDDRLFQVASKAQGSLRQLLLINCVNVSDDGLLRVVAHNPCITKLHVAGCTRFTPGGIMRAVQLLTKGEHRLKSLKISGVYGFQKDDLHTLRSLLDPNPTQHKIFYQNHKESSTMKHTDTDPSIDVDVCPRCNEVRMVFDCPRALCEKTQLKGGECRGCDSCITRCVECGVCIKGVQELEAASCADALCLECWLKLPKCNFCNKPYCSKHADQQHALSASAGFLCATCHSRFNREKCD